MTGRRTDPGQLDLFGGTPESAAIAPVARTAPAVGFGGQADAVVEVLHEVHDGRYGLLGANDRVVHLDGDGHCRYAPDEVAAVVESLVAQRYAKPSYVEVARHGVIPKTVTTLTPTSAGLKLLTRSSSLFTRGSR